jgi:predicted translation initiation factor SUI1
MFPISKENRSLHMEHHKKYHARSDLEQLFNLQPVHTVPPKDQHSGKGGTVHVLLDTYGRKGKSVTIVNGLRHNPTTMEEICRILKQCCGAGGTVKEGKIEIQGDQRARIAEKLTKMHYFVK